MFPLINYDDGVRIKSPITVEQTVIHIDLAQLGFLTTQHMHVLVLDLHISTFTRILQNMNGSYAIREHSTPPPCATPGGFTGCVHATLAISPL